ncbi:MAG: VOC family protein [Hyphomicrobiaceae bacterium]
MTNLPALAFDHIAIAATTLEEGVAFCRERLGVTVPAGGRHPIMNTHNAVMSLGEGVYLEVIAIDPEAGPSERPRWFGLDDANLKARLAAEGPLLVAWIVRSVNVAATVAASPVDLGTVRQMSRGDLRWQIAVRDDGAVPMAGLFPIVIEWPPGPHVSTRMADLGIRLEKVIVRSGAPAALRQSLAAIGAEDLVEVAAMKRGAAPLEAVFQLPDGRTASLTGGGTPSDADRCGG